VRQSNLYIILFAAGLTIVLGALLSTAAVVLGPIQKVQVELDTRKKILSAVMPIQKGDDILSIYGERVSSIVVNIDGEEVATDEAGDPIVAENIDIGRQFKRAPEDRLYPVFKFHSADDPENIEAYIIPVFGNGLWDRIWGYIALETDLNTVRGVVFDHKAETPGLGARITDEAVQERYREKRIFNEIGELVSITMVKAEAGPTAAVSLYDEYHVDGLSGATMTAVGVNNMLRNYFTYYKSYFERVAAEREEAQVPDPDTI
jgi:Na+-transporting NADH:ubiquinone oxidoreductase subunit C